MASEMACIDDNQFDVSGILDCWDIIKGKYNGKSLAGHDYDTEDFIYPEYLLNPVVGKLAWNEPANVLWLDAEIDERQYEGNAEQWGVNKQGRMVWAFFSHCSCYSYERFGEMIEGKDSIDEGVETTGTIKMTTVEDPRMMYMFGDLKNILKRVIEDSRQFNTCLK
jgi:hypothetical protein